MLKSAAATALIIALSITMLTAVSASATTVNAATPYCHWGVRCSIGVRAGTPCVFRPGFCSYGLHATAIIEPPHNGTAVLRDGSFYYSPNLGFTGRDGMKLQFSCQVPVKLQEVAVRCRAPSTVAVAIFVE
jgi:hypothetical protein